MSFKGFLHFSQILTFSYHAYLVSLKKKPLLNRAVRYNLEESLIIAYFRLFKEEPKLVELLLNTFGNDEVLRPVFFECLEMIPYLVYDDSIVIEDEIREEFIKFIQNEMQAQVLQITHQASLEMREEKEIYRVSSEIF